MTLLFQKERTVILQWQDLTVKSSAETVKILRAGKILWAFKGNMIDPQDVKIVRGILIIPGLKGTWEQAMTQTRPPAIHAFDPYTGRELAQARGTLLEGEHFQSPDGRLYFLDFDSVSKPVSGAFTNTYMVVLDPQTRVNERWTFKTAELMPPECSPPLNSVLDVQHFIPDGYRNGAWHFNYLGQKCHAHLSFKDSKARGTLEELQK